MEPLHFVDNKTIDWQEIQELLHMSEKANQWTNFGPVSTLLEKSIHDYLQLDNRLAVVACANATVGLHALVEMLQYLNSKPKRWLACSFGFYCTNQSELRNARIVDCDESGMFDLKAIPDNEYDGAIVTNIFGSQSDLSRYVDYFRSRNKVLIIDSAMALQPIIHYANEIISFHQTKPWGMGEGGCVIVEKEHECLFRECISFAVNAPKALYRWATNGKLSDIAAAFHVQRLRRMPRLQPMFLHQYNRIAALAKPLGLTVLGDIEKHPGTPSNVPLIASVPIHRLTNPYVQFHKYYHPLKPTPLANDIFDRILNVPCHPDMANLSDDRIIAAIKTVLR